MSKAGRKSEYRPEFADRVRSYVDDPRSFIVRGMVSDTKLAALFGVSKETVRKWRRRVPGRENEYQPDFAAACRMIQDAVDTDAVKRSMVERAKGYVQRKVERRVGETGKLTVVKEEKNTMAGDVAAARLVLNNTQGHLPDAEQWDTKDKVEQTHKMDGLTELLNEIDGLGKRLPGQS